jgi:chorismate mutase/prephenate dehydratase
MAEPAKSETLSEIRRNLDAIDREFLVLASKRCDLLKAWREAASGPIVPGLRESLSEAKGNANRWLEENPHASGGDLALPLLTYLAGATYASTIHPVRIAYLGPKQSYSYLAAVRFFGAASGLQSLPSIGAVFEEIERDQSRYGVVPIENSTDGRIVDTLNMFVRMPVQICGEILLPIHHNLLARCQRDAIKTVYSKPQALSQCRAWLSQHLPDVRWVEVASTTAAAKIASEEPGAAAVASVEAAMEHGLDIVARSIEDSPDNATRFVVIGKETPPPTGNDKTSLMFQVPHRPGALADVMVLFKDSGLNLTWIESFPVPGSPNEYFFFVELEGHRDQPSVNSAINALRRTALRLECLGSYPRTGSTEPRPPV